MDLGFAAGDPAMARRLHLGSIVPPSLVVDDIEVGAGHPGRGGRSRHDRRRDWMEMNSTVHHTPRSSEGLSVEVNVLRPTNFLHRHAPSDAS